MKKIIASALAVLLGSLGFVVVDKTIDERVSTLESQVASLSAEKENASSDKIYKVGDKIPCYPETPYSFDSVVGYGNEINVCIDSFTAEIIGIDELNTDGETDVVYSPTKKPDEYNIYKHTHNLVKIEITGRVSVTSDFTASGIAITIGEHRLNIPITDGSFNLNQTIEFATVPNSFSITNIGVIGL